jgi:O-antigen/teichoic acid export membrane protein
MVFASSLAIATAVLVATAYGAGWHLSRLEIAAAASLIASHGIVDFERRIRYYALDDSSALAVTALCQVSKPLFLWVAAPDTIVGVCFALALTGVPAIALYLSRLLTCVFQRTALWRSFLTQLRAARFLMPAALLGFLSTGVPVWILGAAASTAEVGVYVAIRQIVNVGNTVLEWLDNRVLNAFGAQNQGEAGARNTRIRLYGTTLLVGLLAFVAALLTPNALYSHVTGTSWPTASIAAAVLFMGVTGVGVNRIAIFEARGRNVTRFVTWGALAGVAVATAMALSLIPFFSVVGAAVAFTLGKFGGAVVTAWGVYRRGGGSRFLQAKT